MLDVQHLVSLTRLNTLHLAATASSYVALNDLSQLEPIRQIISNYSKFFVLGGGSNLILPETYDGLVIHNQLQGISAIEHDKHYYLVTAMSGENWDSFVAYCVKNGYYGLENLSLIPGTVGAAPVQNIGAYGVEVKDFIDKVQVLDWETGTIRLFENNECQFSYRNSFFKNNPRYLVVSVSFKLLKKAKLNTGYGDVAKYIQQLGNPGAQELRNSIISIRNSKLPDPDIIGNVGSFFHNPIITSDEANQLLSQFPNLPVYPTGDPSKKKVSAGWLIDNMGLKGHRDGNVGVYDKQALVLVNHGNATQSEILKFALYIQSKVAEKYQIKLNIEPIIL